MTIPMLFNANFAGRIAITTGGAWRLRIFSDVWNFGQVTADGYQAQERYTLSGWYINRNGYNYYQTEQPDVYVKMDGSTTVTSEIDSSRGNGQELINGIIKANKRILENNLICARFSHKLTADERTLLFELQSRLEVRNSALLNNQLISKATESTPKGYANEYQYLTQFMASGKMGLAITGTAVIVVSAVVVASMGAAAYFAYKAYYTESLADVKYSDELTAILADKLTPQELEQLKAETAGIVTKARLKSSFGTVSNLFTIGAFAFLGYAIYTFAAPRLSNNKKRKK